MLPLPQPSGMLGSVRPRVQRTADTEAAVPKAVTPPGGIIPANFYKLQA